VIHRVLTKVYNMVNAGLLACVSISLSTVASALRTEIVRYRIYKAGNKLLRTVKFFVFCTILEAVRSLYSVSWHEL
jgi:uncharacterized OsmC-like protein